LIQILKSDLHNRKNSSFDSIAHHWEEQYGTSAFHPLIKIASDKSNEDPDRYIALMSAAKLGGTESAPALLSFLKDRSWMIRSGTLRALSALLNPNTAEAVLPLLQDPALVVRVEAVEAVKILKPKRAAEALLATLEDHNNYHGGKAQWVPQKALDALVYLKAKDIVPKLLTLSEHPKWQKDPQFALQTIQTIEVLTGKNMRSNTPISQK
jgi:hypothetical protein